MVTEHVSVVKAQLAEVSATPLVMPPVAFGWPSAPPAADMARWAKVSRLSGVKPE
jgi:hypothetical protein